MPKISMDEVYKTRNGQSVRVLCTDRDGKYPVVALVGDDQAVIFYCSNGAFHAEPNLVHNFDLIEVVPEKWHYVVGQSEGHFTVSLESYPDAAAAERAFACRLGYGYLAGVWKE